MAMAIGLGLGLCFQGPTATSAPAAFNFGNKTRSGYGGWPVAVTETAGTTFSGTHGAKFVVDDLNHIVPAGTYGTLWTPPPNGATTITSNTTGTAYSVTIIEGMHARERTTAASQQDFSQTFGNATCQLTGYLGDAGNAANPPAQVALGDTIWCRDGRFNPSASNNAQFRFAAASAYAAGTGTHITVRSENPDHSVDAMGWSNNRHGFKIGRINFGGSNGAGVTVTGVDFVEVEFFNDNATPATPDALVKFARAFPISGMTIKNCGFRQPPTFTDLQISASLSGIIALMTDCVVDSNTFRNTCGGVSVNGNGGAGAGEQNVTITSNYFEHMRDQDFIQIGGNTWNLTITDNVGYDCISVTGTHCDGTQYLGLQDGSTTKFWGTYSRNIWVNCDTQGLFIADNVDPAQFTGITMNNNIMHGLQPHQVGISNVSNIVMQWNSVFGPEAAPSGSDCSIGDGTNAIQTRNLARSYNYAFASAMLGTITKVPASQVTVGATTAAIQALFPNYVAPANITTWSLAGLKALFTPSTAAFNGALAQSGALTDSGAWNATP